MSLLMTGVRQAIDNLRHQWLGVRIGGEDATLRGQWLVLSISLALVFACFFAIGRLRAGGGAASPGAAPAALVSPSGQAAVPTGLSGGSPIAGAVPVAIAVKPRLPAAVAQSSNPNRVATSTGPSFPAEAASGESASSESQSSESQSSTPAPEPTHETAPTQASTPAQGSGGSGSSHQSSSKGGAQSSGGASFDSSE